MDNKLSLLRKIEHCRAEMIRLSHTNQLTSTPVISASMKLDFLLNELEKVNNKRIS